LLVETAENLKKVVEYHQVRVREGAMAEVDLLRVRLEAQRLNVDINHALLEAERARIHLFREMGQSEFPAVKFTDTVEAALLDSPVAALETAMSNRLELRVARSAAEQARAHRSLQLAMAKPNVDVLFGYKRTAGFGTMLGGVQVDIPFRNKNQGNIAATAAEIRLAESNLAATEALIRAEYEAAWSAYQLHRRDVVTFLQPLLEQSEETYRIADAAYRLGGADLLRLLDAQRVRIEARIAYVRGLTEVREAQAALEAAMGVDR
jgi:cobalt-zinc-cadmium efflux system outer membrane protein